MSNYNFIKKKKMKKLNIFIYLCLCVISINAQSLPWQSPLKICTSTNGINFTTSSVFQDSSGVASVIRIGSASSDTLLCAFQWFPAPQFSTYWDKIAVKYSYNGGVTWTSPISCQFSGLPVGYQRPFDPCLLKLPNGQIRMYFSSSTTLAPPAGGIDTYSGISNDGVTYTFEPTPRFDDATKHAIDPTVAIFGGTYYYNSWTGNNADGAHRAISNNGTTFTTQTVNPYDGSHLWLGNYLVDGTNLKFYGCGSGMWVNSSTNGTTWGTYTPISIMGADPSVVKNKSGTYVMIYTGPPNTSSIEKVDKNSNLSIYPNIFEHFIFITHQDNDADYDLEIVDVFGKIVYKNRIPKNSDVTKIELEFLPVGSYYCKLSNEHVVFTKSIVKIN